MYIPVAQRQDQGTALPAGTTVGYVPVAQRQTVEREVPAFEPFKPSFKTAQSTDETLIGQEGKSPQAIVGGFARDVGQSIARNIASAGVTIAKKIDPNVETLKAEDMKSFFGQAFVETIFGKGEEIKSIEQRIAEAEPKVEAWKKDLEEVLTTPGLNAREKFVLKVLSNIDTPSFTFLGVMGSVGLDLSPFGSLEKGAYKAIVKVATMLIGNSSRATLITMEQSVRTVCTFISILL